MKKYVLIGIAVLVVVLVAITMTSGSAKIETKHYENGEVSFDYPSSWQQVSTQGSQIVAFKDPETGIFSRFLLLSPKRTTVILQRKNVVYTKRTDGRM